MPLLALTGITGIYKMRHNLKAMSIYTLLVVSALTLVKSSAIFFAAIILIYYLYERPGFWGRGFIYPYIYDSINLIKILVRREQRWDGSIDVKGRRKIAAKGR